MSKTSARLFNSSKRSNDGVATYAGGSFAPSNAVAGSVDEACTSLTPPRRCLQTCGYVFDRFERGAWGCGIELIYSNAQAVDPPVGGDRYKEVAATIRACKKSSAVTNDRLLHGQKSHFAEIVAECIKQGLDWDSSGFRIVMVCPTRPNVKDIGVSLDGEVYIDHIQAYVTSLVPFRMAPAFSVAILL